ARGRTLDVHALRTTFGTLLSKGGVPLRTAQAAMRHSDPSLTANVYTDPRLLDVARALDALPALPVAPASTADQARLRATGTDSSDPRRFALQFALTQSKPGPVESFPDNSTGPDPGSVIPGGRGATGLFDRGKDTIDNPYPPMSSICPAGLEPATFSSGG